ncbi:MAG: hypothetical protein ACXWIU_15240, partial [Limisphaerales bacterium]
HQKLNFADCNVRHVAQDWSIIMNLVENAAGFAILPAYVQTHNPSVESFEIPESILAALDFYAVFESGLKKIEAFRNLLAFARLP